MSNNLWFCKYCAGLKPCFKKIKDGNKERSICYDCFHEIKEIESVFAGRKNKIAERMINEINQ